MRVRVEGEIGFYCRRSFAMFNSVRFFKGKDHVKLITTFNKTHLVFEQLNLGL